MLALQLRSSARPSSKESNDQWCHELGSPYSPSHKLSFEEWCPPPCSAQCSKPPAATTPICGDDLESWRMTNFTATEKGYPWYPWADVGCYHTGTWMMTAFPSYGSVYTLPSQRNMQDCHWLYKQCLWGGGRRGCGVGPAIDALTGSQTCA